MKPASCTNSFLTLLVFLGIISLSQAILCYICNSRDPSLEGSKDIDYGPDCVDPFNSTSTVVPLVDCNTTREEVVNPKTNYTTHHIPNACVKVVTTGSQVTENRVSEDVSELTSRFCGYTTKGSRCSGMDGVRSHTETCYCTKDGCNSAPSLYNPAAMLVPLALVAAIFLVQCK